MLKRSQALQLSACQNFCSSVHLSGWLLLGSAVESAMTTWALTESLNRFIQYQLKPTDQLTQVSRESETSARGRRQVAADRLAEWESGRALKSRLRQVCKGSTR